MRVPYTQGIWQVKPGYADEFVAGWVEFVGWTTSSVEGSGVRMLFRDLGDDHRFVRRSDRARRSSGAVVDGRRNPYDSADQAAH